MANPEKPSSSNTDLKSPYYLHPSDHPGLPFVTQPLNENGENYFVWRKTFLNALRSKNKAGFLDGTIKTPNVDSEEYTSWQQCNAVVLAWLTNALAKELQGAAAHAETARDVWLDLEERFMQGIDARLYELRRSLASIRQERTTISVYYGRLKTVWGELQSFETVPTCNCGKCACGLTKEFEKLREKEKVFDFLMGLDESFRTVRSQILSVDPLPTVSKAYALVAQEEKQRNVAHNMLPQMDAAAMAASHFDSLANATHRTSVSGGSKGERPRCSFCGKLGHIREKCFELVGYPPDRGQRRTRPNRPPNRAEQYGHGASSKGFAVHTEQQDAAANHTSGELAISDQTIAGLSQQQRNQLLQLLGQVRAQGIDGAHQPAANLVASANSINQPTELDLEEVDWSG